jgi:hypothetical protein
VRHLVDLVEVDAPTDDEYHHCPATQPRLV